MNSEEHGLLADLFKNLRGAEAQPRDPEAEQFVLQAIQAQPSAPYYMAQAVVIQQQALAAAQTRIEELERRAREAEARAEAAAAQAAQAQAPSGGGSFLANALGLGKGGGWGARPAQPASPPPPLPNNGGPVRPDQPASGVPGSMMPAQPASGQQPARNAWGLPITNPQQGGPAGRPNAFGGQPQQAQQPQRSGFLAGAMQTAAGVAGGMLVASAISSMLSGGKDENAGSEAQTASTEPTDAGAAADNGYQQADYQDDSQQQDSGYQEASYDDGGYDDGGFDDGGDWA